MIEEKLLRLLKVIEGLGGWLSILAWLTVAVGSIAMAFVLRHEKSRAVWIVSVIVGIIALTANLADYYVTLYRSPDLSLEANPLWRNIADYFGIDVARWYGLTGKIFVSILSGQMFAFYLTNRKRLFPESACSFPGFIIHLGNKSKTLGQRFTALCAMFAFFFAGMQLLYFYIAYLNWFADSASRNQLLSVPTAILILIISLVIGFTVVTYRSFRIDSSRGPVNSCDRKQSRIVFR